jgi:hypothetical protein
MTYTNPRRVSGTGPEESEQTPVSVKDTITDKHTFVISPFVSTLRFHSQIHSDRSLCLLPKFDAQSRRFRLDRLKCEISLNSLQNGLGPGVACYANIPLRYGGVG